MAMTFRIFFILSLFSFSIQNIYCKCDCQERFEAHAQNRAVLWDLKICYLQKLLNELEETVFRASDVLAQWRNEYNALENYIANCAIKCKRLDSAYYRLYRFIYITDRKIGQEVRTIEHHLNQVSFELTTNDLSDKIECIRKNWADCSHAINFEEIRQIQSRFNSLSQNTNNLINAINNFAVIIEARCEQISAQQCCWY